MLQGQWFGPVQGTNIGDAIVDVDRIGDQLVGTATFFDKDLKRPAVFAKINFPLDATSFCQRIPLFPIDWNSGNPVLWQQIANRYPGVKMSTVAATQWDLQGDTLHVSWITDIGRTGTAELRRGAPEAQSNLIPLPVTCWEEFKQHLLRLDKHRFIFRGQSERKRLRTYFHRTRRADLRMFISEDVKTLYASLTGLTPHVFNLRDPIEYGAFLTLAQHHGYPTPLLDWTRSPFVAAYFAYRKLSKKKRTADHRVRIFLFDQTRWISDFPQFLWITPAPPHFSIFTPVAINNPRLAPQQALLTISNVDDIERLIADREATKGRAYLHVVDLPGSERNEVMHELSLMGITAGALFPGLDGVCEQLRERNFDL